METDLRNAIELHDVEAAKQILSRADPQQINTAADSNLTFLAHAVDLVEDSYIQSGMEVGLEIIQLLIAAGADPDKSGVGRWMASAREIAERSSQERLRRVFDP